MSTAIRIPIDSDERARQVSSELQRYAKRHAAGAFATPTKAELLSGKLDVDSFIGPEGHVTLRVAKRLTRASVHRDWTGAEFYVVGRVATHFARHDDAHSIPAAIADDVDYTFAYMEDRELTSILSSFKQLVGIKITAASEVIGCWGPPGSGRPRYPEWDLVTLRGWPIRVSASAIDESLHVDGWFDDYPFYSDGTWGAVSLRGFYPEDPSLGVKPAEMDRKWREAHPDDLKRRCEWTTLAERVPALTALAHKVLEMSGGESMERVRLLRMAGREGGGRLARHTDITDRNFGTRNGQVVRFHVPIITHPSITMQVWDLDGSTFEHHLSPQRMWYLDARKPHAVTNPTAADRIHLCVDVIVAEPLRWLLAADPARVFAVRQAAHQVWRPEGVDVWMRGQNRLLEGRSPLQCIAEGDWDRPLDLIAALADGTVM